MELQFLGAARTVTGSRFILREGDSSILIEAGLFQGPSELKQLNWDPNLIPYENLSCVILTHAHIDHTGLAPRLVKYGYTGSFYCTEATSALLSILWPDSAHLQEEEAAFANKTGYSRHRPALPLYALDDVYQALRQVKPMAYRSPLVREPWEISFYPAGHILGSSYVHVKHRGNGKSIVFSGDLGRYDSPLMKPPEPPPTADWLVMESTYGDKLHDLGNLPDQLKDLITRGYQKGAVILIPAFSVGRTQVLLYYLAKLNREKRIPEIPVVVDSPMAIDVTSLYLKFGNELNLDVDLKSNGKTHPLYYPNLRFVRSVHESKQLNKDVGPMIIISASGMCNGGRILHHLKHKLHTATNMLVFVGYQAEGTLGRELLEGARKIVIHGEQVPVLAEIIRLEGFSAHGDFMDLARWIQCMEKPPREIFLVHGEPQPMETLAEKIRKEFQVPVHLPSRGDKIKLDDSLAMEATVSAEA